MARMHGLWWWIDRWQKSSAYKDLSLEEQGAYRNLLDEAALRGGALPDDERILGKVCGDALAWKRIKKNVMRYFHLKAEGWRNETLDEVLAESEKRAIAQRNRRNREGNADSNVGSNGSCNVVANADSNAHTNVAYNDHRPPDPDPDPISGSTYEDQDQNKPALKPRRTA